MDRFAKKSETDLALDTKVDKVTGYGLSQESFSTIEKAKLSSLSNLFKGTFTSEANLIVAYPTGAEGWYALVDEGVSKDAKNYIWDTTDNKWVKGGGSGVSTLQQVTDLGATTDEVITVKGLVAEAGTATRPPIKIPAGVLTTIPQAGALERDASGKLYSTKADGTRGEMLTGDVSDLVVSASALTVANFSTGIATVTGIQGQVSYDANYKYDCVGTNQWRRSALNGDLVDLYLADIDDSGGDKTTAQLDTIYPSAKVGQQAWGVNRLYIKKGTSNWKKITITTA